MIGNYTDRPGVDKRKVMKMSLIPLGLIFIIAWSSIGLSLIHISSKWLKQYDREILIPSTQFFATTGAGCLFPPGSGDSRAFNKEKIFELCPYADDIWMNLMVLAKGVRTVCAVRNFGLRYSAVSYTHLDVYKRQLSIRPSA